MPTRTVYETGGSTVVSLPTSIQDETGIGTGTDVLVKAEDGRIVIAEAEISEAHRPQGGDA